MAKKQIHFNAFEMNCITHLSPGLWRYPGDEALRYKDIEYWQNIAKIAEKGLFDAIFIADVLGVYDLYNNSSEAALRGAVQTPVNDPIQLAAIGAAVTQNLGFGITAGVPFEQPFPFARRLSTLDHLTKGRVGWNIVTGYLPSANLNIGQKELPHDERYAQADEYMEVLYKLLEGSWEDDAVILDRASGAFSDPSKIHPINHKGKYYDVPGIHICEPSIQRTPVLFQAGNSPRGLEFAAKHAEAIFIAPIAKEYTKEAVKQVRQALIKAGRDPYSAKIYVLATIITDKTQKLAEAKYKDLLSYVNLEGSLVLNSGWLGDNLGKYQLDDLINDIKSNAMLAKVEEYAKSKTNEGKPWSLRELIKVTGIGALGQKIVGGAKEACDELEKLVEYSDADGFNLAYATTPGTFEDVVEYIVPELQKRGSYQLEYQGGSLRNKLFGKGDRLTSDHIGSKYRYNGEFWSEK
ncbi:LLM class flavin-dependent oxidoreductase [Campylobacter lanienae]|uniref:LLM class flavin-dependent oxidoreductase n=1 Tax=Campylobacter lanienae TaxID=75658 RepID=UPI002432B574|nr:LLM class flavin-dependent oxidoreductase [Campylobacter lanienae]MCI5540324.1 LLM class flavin-dependent oxidoreductase [Campylobacter lanienae]MDD7514845.1 LLM class flavin-dependent oxidoreductase [Campylobacter lanienae]MDY5519849.1 LLM class flavin-dependent oxidoreductase [Campylobacter lanienae]MDY6135473.1 LLM class flavin-dependent oxidoreductase [Campylobacter lanienae]